MLEAELHGRLIAVPFSRACIMGEQTVVEAVTVKGSVLGLAM